MYLCAYAKYSSDILDIKMIILATGESSLGYASKEPLFSTTFLSQPLRDLHGICETNHFTFLCTETCQRHSDGMQAGRR